MYMNMQIETALVLSPCIYLSKKHVGLYCSIRVLCNSRQTCELIPWIKNKIRQAYCFRKQRVVQFSPAQSRVPFSNVKLITFLIIAHPGVMHSSYTTTQFFFFKLENNMSSFLSISSYINVQECWQNRYG